jgi:RNA polymerase sigma-B factor
MDSPSPRGQTGTNRSATATLLSAYHGRGDITARDRLVELYLPLVESFAHRYARSSADYDDLHQVGCIGLINAIDRFDAERGEDLTAFAVPNIVGEIRRYLRDRGAGVRLPRRVLELRTAALGAQAELASELGRSPTTADIAQRLGADEQDVAAALDAARAAQTVELAADTGPEAPAGAEALETAEDRLFLSGAFRNLDDRERRVLFLRYVRDAEPDEIARELGMSRRQLSRTTQGALAKLRLGLEGGDVGAGSQSLARASDEPNMARKGAGEGARRGLDLDHYITQPYHIELVKDDDVPDGGWTAHVEELPGCTAHGSTADEATRGIERAMRDWIADALANRRDVPKPRSAASHSGRLLVRMPQSLHAELARAADREEVSLNQFITSSLASAIGWRRDDAAGAAGAAGAAVPDASPAPDARGGLRTALMVNLVVLAIVAVVAVVLLVIALGHL